MKHLLKKAKNSKILYRIGFVLLFLTQKGATTVDLEITKVTITGTPRDDLSATLPLELTRCTDGHQDAQDFIRKQRATGFY